MMRALSRVVVAACVAVGKADAQAPVTIAVLPFEDRGSYGQDKEVFRALELGVPALLSAELAKHPSVRLADRARVSAAMKAENLGADARIDAATAARVGTQAGARYAVTGNFADFYGKFRSDARVVEVATGQILKVVSNNDAALQDRANLARMVQDMAAKVLSAAGLTPRTAATSAPVPPTDAVTQYSLGLLYENEGDKAKAGEHYQRALTAFPGYAEAREGVQRVR